MTHMSSRADTEDVNGPAPDLKRVLGPKLLLLFIVGDILGAGIYAVTGEMAARGRRHRLAAVPGGVRGRDADGVLLPRAGHEVPPGRRRRALHAQGVRHPLRHVPGRVRGGLLRHHQRLDVVQPARRPTCCAGFDGLGWHVPQGNTAITVVAMAFMVLLARINLRGVGESVKFNVVLTLVEMAALAIVIVIGFWVMAKGDGDMGRIVVFETPAPTGALPRRHRRDRDRVLRDGRLRGLGQHGRGDPGPGADLPAG